MPVAGAGAAGQAPSDRHSDTSSQQGVRGRRHRPGNDASSGRRARRLRRRRSWPPIAAADGATGDSAAQPVSAQVARQVAVLRTGRRRAHDDPGPHPGLARARGGPGDPAEGHHRPDPARRPRARPGRAPRGPPRPPPRPRGRRTQHVPAGGRPRQRRRLAGPAQRSAAGPAAGDGPAAGLRRPRRPAGQGRGPVTTVGRACRYQVSGPAPSTNRSTSSGVDYRI